MNPSSTPRRRKPSASAQQHRVSKERTLGEVGTSAVQNAGEEKESVFWAALQGDDLLERAKLQWQFGDWDGLIGLDPSLLARHPEREKLALLVAAAHFQVSKACTRFQFMSLAPVAGCGKKLVSQVLASGVHNSLGRAALVASDERKAIRHFECAIRLVTPAADIALSAHARMVKEMIALGLLPQAGLNIDQLRRKVTGATSTRNQCDAHIKVLDMEVDLLRERLYSLKKQLDQAKNIDSVLVFGNDTKSQLPLPKMRSGNVDPAIKTYYGLNGLDRKLEAYLDYDGGYFVELGANDGVSQSNTCYFEKERGWRGLLIEPVLHNFLKCRANRSRENAFACVACVSFSYDQSHVNLIYSNLMTTPTGVETDISDPRSHAYSGKVYLQRDELPVEIIAPAKTLTTLLSDANAPLVIDLLSLDVEGAELEVLKGIDHKRYRFKYVLIECRDEKSLAAYMSTVGYTRVDKLSNHDYLFSSQA